jgi:plasmid replication initiation protein
MKSGFKGRYSDDIVTSCHFWYRQLMEQVEGGGITEHQDLATFMAIASDVAVKDQMDLMSRCWFSLTANRTDPIEHAFEDRRSGRKETVRITGTQEHGIATIYDQDLLIFVISQLVEANRKGVQASRRVRFTPYQFFAWINRTPTGSAYQRLRDSLQRLRTTTIETTIRSESTRRDRIKQFSWISEFGTVEKDGKLSGVEVVVAEWLFESVQGLNVLTLNKRYFDIAGPVERWLYQYARKATGGATGRWIESIKSLYAKSASQQEFKHYADTLRKVAKKNDLPGLRLEIRAGTNGGSSLFMERTEKRESVEVASHEQLLLIEPSPLEEAWENALAALDKQLGPEVTASWLTPLQPVSFEEGTLTYRAPTKFIADWVQSRYLDRLREAWTAVGYDVENIAIATALKKSAA